MELFYRTYGEGQPIIILHGLYGMSDNWVTHAKLLSEKYKVYIPDMRNHGQSGHSDLFNYNLMAEDIGEFIQMHNLENPIIMGHSMGGKVAMSFALDNPNRVSKLIVVDMSMRAYKQNDFNYQLIYALLDIDFTKIKSRKEIEERLDQTLQNQRIRMFLMKNLYWTDQKILSWRFNIKAIFDNIDAVFEGIQSTQQFDKPCLFIRGGESDYVSDEDFTQIQHNFPQAILKTIHKAGHWVQADEPEIFMTILQNFLMNT
ncbi:MAG: alpha/beta fold hydrolase [Bacteroidetes bacterium]|nr:alpha/beta fold hydrolase [Bacteroidota bacterium]